ncbi:ATP-binding protein [Aquabacterium sp.]|uniref:ATP-binding protein n=1 Tax=Aquabacterium sp. TaxID=1872578 RepID=UPI002B75A1B0|nr:ATP-binding protein [Aquabacterium sp.]HSW07534.1 ATP-binding protein [Aquabacterium sp.]
MPRDREDSALSARPGGAALPLALGVAAIVAALLAWQREADGAFAALALLLTATACLLAGALWARQRQQARLHDARQQQQLLLQMSDAWVWQTDAEHRLVRLQPPAGAPASSWAEGAFSGQLLWERFAPADTGLQARMQAFAAVPELRVQQAQAQAGASGKANGLRTWRLRGQPRFDSRGSFAGYLGLARPADEADAEAAEREGFSALLRNGPVALCVAGAPAADGRLQLQRLNPAARKLLGLGDEGGVGLPWEQALAGLPEGLRQGIQALQPGQSAEHDGWTAWLAVLGSSAAGDGSGGAAAPRRLLAIVPRDGDGASQLLAAEHASFSYTVSHDLRAPIRVVEGFTRILKEDYGHALDRIGNDHLDRVLSAAARMNSMIDALLSLSQLSTQPLQRQPVNLSQLGQYVVDDLRRMAPEREAEIHIEPGLVTQGDPTLLRMALENLIGNAWKYSGKTARAKIAFEQCEHAGRKAFLVRDNGAGFDMRFADRLFGVFQRLHSSGDFQGTGVGLASVRRIIRRHGGEIWAESEVGKGAKFYFTLQA